MQLGQQVKGIQIGKKESFIHIRVLHDCLHRKYQVNLQRSHYKKISEFRKFAARMSEYKNQMHFCKLAKNKQKY